MESGADADSTGGSSSSERGFLNSSCTSRCRSILPFSSFCIGVRFLCTQPRRLPQQGCGVRGGRTCERTHPHACVYGAVPAAAETPRRVPTAHASGDQMHLAPEMCRATVRAKSTPTAVRNRSRAMRWHLLARDKA